MHSRSEWLWNALPAAVFQMPFFGLDREPPALPPVPLQHPNETGLVPIRGRRPSDEHRHRGQDHAAVVRFCTCAGRPALPTRDRPVAPR